MINDERDAQDLAAMLRIGRLTEAWIAPPEVREPRELVRYRYSSVRHRTSAKAQIHRVMAKNGILPVVGELWGPISTIDHRLRDGRGYRVLVRLPGVGKVIVSMFVAEIGDVRPPRTTQLEELPDRPKKPYLDRHGPLCTAYGGHLHTTAACSPPLRWRPASQSRHRYGTASLLGLSAVTARVISAVSASHVRLPFGWRSRCCFWDMFKSTGVLVDTDRRARRVPRTGAAPYLEDEPWRIADGHNANPPFGWAHAMSRANPPTCGGTAGFSTSQFLVWGSTFAP